MFCLGCKCPPRWQSPIGTASLDLRYRDAACYYVPCRCEDGKYPSERFFYYFFFNTNAQETNAIKCIRSAIDSVMPLLLCLLEENVSELRREACTHVLCFLYGCSSRILLRVPVYPSDVHRSSLCNDWVCNHTHT